MKLHESSLIHTIISVKPAHQAAPERQTTAAGPIRSPRAHALAPVAASCPPLADWRDQTQTDNSAITISILSGRAGKPAYCLATDIKADLLRRGVKACCVNTNERSTLNLLISRVRDALVFAT